MNELYEQRKEFFNERAAGWLDNHYKGPETGNYDLYADRIKEIVAALALSAHSRVLDAGCGSGVLVPYLLDRLGPDGRIIEMDFAEEMIRENKKHHTDDRISFICCDAARMEMNKASLDAVICFAAFPHFSAPEEGLKRMSNALKSKGRLVIAHLMSSKELADHHHSFTPVSNDRLPEKEVITAWITACGLRIDTFEDRPGLYLLAAVKP